MPTAHQHIQACAVFAKSHLISRLHIQEGKGESCLIGVLAIETVNQRAQHLIICPVGKLALLAYLKTVVEKIVEWCCHHLLEGICHVVRLHALEGEAAIVANAHLTLCAKHVECIFGSVDGEVLLNGRHGHRLLIDFPLQTYHSATKRQGASSVLDVDGCRVIYLNDRHIQGFLVYLVLLVKLRYLHRNLLAIDLL